MTLITGQLLRGVEGDAMAGTVQIAARIDVRTHVKQDGLPISEVDT